MDLMDYGAVPLAALVRRKEASPVEIVQAALARIEARRELNAFITVTADEALAAARRAEAAVMAGEPLGPLHGIPYSVKDLTLTAGVRTTMGSAIHEDFVPKDDAVAVARAKAAGAILIGKTLTPEFGHKQVPTAPLFGRTLNPINPAYTPGASSSGAAAAVAAGGRDNATAVVVDVVGLVAETPYDSERQRWVAIFGAATTLLLPDSEKQRAAQLWELVDGGAGFDAVLDQVLAPGLSVLPAFVLL
eukprot:gene34915-39482_t